LGPIGFSRAGVSRVGPGRNKKALPGHGGTYPTVERGEGTRPRNKALTPEEAKAAGGFAFWGGTYKTGKAGKKKKKKKKKGPGGNSFRQQGMGPPTPGRPASPGPGAKAVFCVNRKKGGAGRKGWDFRRMVEGGPLGLARSPKAGKALFARGGGLFKFSCARDVAGISGRGEGLGDFRWGTFRGGTV